MFSADLLAANDRCARAGYYSRDWEFSRLHPTEVLRRAVDVGLMSEEDDAGQAAGDHVMTLAAERGIDIEGSGVYAIANHTAALADILTTTLRQDARWERPADRTLNGLPWVSSAFLDSSGVRLHRFLLVDRISEERIKAEKYAWKTLGEQSVYELPMTIHVVVLGQRRDQKYHGAWSKGYLHPHGRMLRIKKRSGESFSGKWTIAWREDHDTISRDKWRDQMGADGALQDSLFEIDCDPPPEKLASEIRRLAEQRLNKIRELKDIPGLQPSACWWPTPCAFAHACWNFQKPSYKSGFLAISALPLGAIQSP